MKKYFLPILSLLLSTSLFSQTLVFEKSFNFSYLEQANSMVATSDGGLLITGQTNTAIDHSAMLLFKFDANGDSLWSRTYGGDSTCLGHSIKPTLDGNFIIAGNYGAQAYILKVNPSGDSLWSKTFYNENSSGCMDVIELNNGNLVILQQIYLLPSSTNIICIDSEGNEIWTYYTSLNFERLYKLNDNNILAAGHNGMAQDPHFALGKFDNSGNVIFNHIYNNFFGISTASAHLGDSLFFLGGYHEVNNHWIANILKADENGVLIEEQSYFSGAGTISVILDLKIINNQYVLSCGQMNLDTESFILATNLNGDSINSLILNTYTKQCTNTMATIGQYLYVAGYNTIAGEGSNIYIAKIDLDLFLTSINPSENFGLSNVTLFPNPVDDELFIQWPQSKIQSEIEYSIFDVNGKLVKNNKINCNDGLTQINVGHLNNGIYYLSLWDKNQNLSYKKFIINH